MGKKLEMVRGGLQLVVAIGVSTLVGGALVLVTPNKLGAIKKIAVGAAGLAISSMAVDEVTTYVEKEFNAAVAGFKKIFQKKEERAENMEKVEEVEAQA